MEVTLLGHNSVSVVQSSMQGAHYSGSAKLLIEWRDNWDFSKCPLYSRCMIAAALSGVPL